MSRNVACSVYIGNLDEKVSERVLYDILIQAGRVVDLHIPRDQETDRPRGFAFAEYETEEIAEYAVKLFSGVVTLYNRTLKFAMSGRDKAVTNGIPGSKPTLNSNPIKLSASYRSSAQEISGEQASPGVTHQTNGHRTHVDGNSYDYSRRAFGAPMDGTSRSRLSRGNKNAPLNFTYY